MNVKQKHFYYLLGVVFSLGILYFLLPFYAKKAIKSYPIGIDDYKLFPKRLIKCGRGNPWQSKELIDNEIPSKHEKTFTKLKTSAFLIVKDQQIVFEKYWGNFSRQSKSNSFSMAKSIVGILTGIAIDKGYVETIDDPVNKYLKGFNDSSLTIKNVLTMSSGLNWDESYGKLFSKTTDAYYGNNLDKLILSLQLTEPSGETFKYLSCNTQILAMVIKEASGMTLSQFAETYLWKLIGAEHDAFWSLDRENGTEKSFCCFNATARDFARIGQLVLNEGMWQGKEIVSKEYIQQLQTPTEYRKDIHGNSVDYYGYHWWIINYNGKKVTFAKGLLGQYIFIVPEDNLVIVRIGSKRYEAVGKGVHPRCVPLYLDVAYEILNNQNK